MKDVLAARAEAARAPTFVKVLYRVAEFVPPYHMIGCLVLLRLVDCQR